MADCPEKTCPQPAPEPPGVRPFDYWKLLFALLLLLGLAVRLAYITQESIWWDEFATVAFLEPPPEYRESPHFEQWNQVVIRQSSPTLSAFLRQNSELDPAAMPMYLAVEYYWNKYVHSSPVALRLLSVLFGMAVLPVLFLLGRRIYGTPAGLVAMFCAALSPIHIQFSKEIRMYGLMTLLAVVAVYAFHQILETRRRRWWLLYAVAMLLLSWTHPFALLLPFAQGLFWLLACPRDIVRLVKFTALTVLVTLPAALWVLSIQFWGQDSTDEWMRVPTLVELVNDIFADDAIGATYQVNATPHVWARFVGNDAARWIISWRWAVGRAFVVAVLAAMAWVFVATAAPRDTLRKSAATVRGALSPFKWSLFLSLWLIIPPLFLYLVSVAWRPCHQPRYTVHASLGLYLLLGGAIAMLPRRFLRVTAVVCLLLFYGYQQTLMLGEPQHPDWLGASRMIREEGKPDDLVMSHNWLWKRVFAYNLGPVPNVVCYGSQFDILAEKSAFFLDLTLPSIASETEPREVWVVVQTEYFTRGTIAPLEREFDARGLDYDAHEFGGIQRVILYRVRRGPHTPAWAPMPNLHEDAPREFADLAMEFWRAREYETAIAAARAATRINPHHARAWSYMGMSYKELGREEEAMEAFQQALEIDPADYPWSLNNYAELLIRAGRHEQAVQIARQALDVLPGDCWSQALLGRAYHGLGDYPSAREALLEALQGDCPDMRIPQWLEEAENALRESGRHE